MNMGREIFRRLWLLLWKNLILRKRQYIVTTVEILLPILFAILMAYIRAKIRSSGPGSSGSIFPITREEQLILATQSRLFGYNSFNNSVFLGFAPNTTEVTSFVTNDLGPLLLRNNSYGEDVGIHWLGFDNDAQIEDYVTEKGGFQSGAQEDQLKAALVINGLSAENNFGEGHKVSYKIRLIDQFYDTTKSSLMPWIVFSNDCEFGSGGGSTYHYSGFLGLQIMMDKLLTEKMTNTEFPSYTVNTNQFPCPGSDGFDFNQLYFLFMPQLMIIGFIFIIPSIVRGIVSEKETGIKELMKMTGIPNWMHWVSWMINSLMVLIISISIVVLLLFIPFNSEVGGVLKNSNPLVWWLFFLVYAIWATSFCFLISSVFERPTLATTCGIVVWLVTYYGVSLPLESRYATLSLTSKMFLCLSPNMGLHYGLKVLSAFEAKKGIGAQWNNIAKSSSSIDSLSLGHVLLMLIISSFLYILLAMYIENIVPTKYGVRKSWYFIFMPSTWGFGKDKSEEDVETLRSQALASDGKSFEPGPSNLKVGLEILKLRKQFGEKVAVDDVSFKAYEGQIFCLLGHNGAGKTTTMSVLTGLLSASGGTALIDGKDIRTQMEEIRQNLGLCPQHNLLFSKLTVNEHLRFFGMVKGLSSLEAESQIPTLIKKLQLEEKANVLAMSLSGGQKRRLSLGCSIIGDSKILYLDECSSGLDPEARRVIWDLLLEIREQRTIILTTHFLEEAEVLADRVGIMAAGRIQCSGTPGFLKKFYGTGYNLALSLTSDNNCNQILLIVQGHIPSAFIKSTLTKGGVVELGIALPSEENSTSSFPPMFHHLLSQQEHLGILDVGISLTTMDDVFIKVEELSQMSESRNTRNLQNDNSIFTTFGGEKSTGIALFIQQFWGLMLKKILYSIRRWKLTLSQMVIPIALIIAAVLITNLMYGTSDKTPPLTITLNSYADQAVLYSQSDSAESKKLGEDYAKVVSRGAKNIPMGSNLTYELLKIAYEEEEAYFQRHLVAADLSDFTNLNAMYSSIPGHVSPLSVNLITNAMLRYLDGGNNAYKIEVTNHPLSSGMREIFDAASPNPLFVDTAPFVVGVLVSIGLALLAASFIVMPIEERKCKCKQLQLMTGVNPFVFWGSAFSWDYFVTLVVLSIMVACLFIFEDHDAFTNNGGAGAAFLIMSVYGIGAISFSYLLSLVAQTPAGGFALITIVHIITGAGFAIGVFILQDDISLVGNSKVIGWIGRLFPTYGVAKSMMVWSKTATKNSRCGVIPDDIKSLLCKSGDSNYYIPKSYQACCDNCLELGARCFKPQSYLVWSYQEEQEYDYYPGQEEPPFLPGIGQELVFMGLMFTIYLALLMLIEFGWMKMLLNKIWKQNSVDFISNADDNDVLQETARVKQLIEQGTTDDDAILVENLSKSYGKFCAVSKLSFGVHKGECFGLLGVNGAGKTTTFKMLTGDEIISHGDAYLQLNSLQRDRKTFLSKVAYCPQFDGIIGVLTGFEMLQLFGRLRGVKNVESDANNWLDRFGLLDSGRKQCQNYSGGMKRRLSAAMALVGDPPILLLDEPTSGVDAVSRRQFWNIISSLKEAGKSIILTSHSMDECENLCSRLGIMVNGELQCVGRVQHLKNKFGQGYTLTIRMRPVEQMDGFMMTLVHNVTAQFNPCILKDHHQNVAQFHIQSTNIGLDTVFERMERIKNDFGGFIQDYSVQQTSLEDIFLNFARRQYTNPREVQQSSPIRKFVSSIFRC